jgi:hypothetical protein
VIKTSFLLVGCVAATATGLLAQSIVVPAARATTPGTGGLNTITRGATFPRTYMWGINASELTAIPVGAPIVGFSVRTNISVSNVAMWPPSTTTWTDYTIQVGPAIPVATFTGAFPSNFSSTPTTVRTGPMTLEANTFASPNVAGTPNPFCDFYFDFQRPHIYTGGDLGIYLTHPGSSQATHVFIDNIAVSAAAHGVAFSAAAHNAVSGGASAAFCIPRIYYGYGNTCPRPGGLGPVLVQTNDVLTGAAAGGPVTFAIGNGVPGAAHAYNIGLAPTSIPVLGCTVLTLPITSASGTLDANGRRRLNLVVPPGATGVVNLQAVTLDPMAANGFFTLTQGTTFTFN